MEQKHIEGKGAALLARCPDVPVYAAELDVLTQLTGFHLTRGMLCAMRRPKLRDPAVLLQDASRVAVLENVMNPTNLGRDLPLCGSAWHGRGAADERGAATHYTGARCA